MGMRVGRGGHYTPVNAGVARFLRDDYLAYVQASFYMKFAGRLPSDNLDLR
jgi:hypothetical protein